MSWFKFNDTTTGLYGKEREVDLNENNFLFLIKDIVNHCRQAEEMMVVNLYDNNSLCINGSSIFKSCYRS